MSKKANGRKGKKREGNIDAKQKGEKRKEK